MDPNRSTTRLPPITTRATTPPPRSGSTTRAGIHPPANPSKTGTPLSPNPSRTAPIGTTRSPSVSRIPASKPAPPPPPPPPPPAVAATAMDSFTRNVLEELTLNHAKHTARYNGDELPALIQRSREQAKKLGFNSDDEIQQFIQCVVLLNDELTAQNPRNSDVWFTLTNVSRPGPMRLRRAMSICQRLADQPPPPESEQPAMPPPRPVAESVPPPPAMEPVREESPPRAVEPPKNPLADAPPRSIAEPPPRPTIPTAPPPEAVRPAPPPAREPLREIPTTPPRDNAPLPEIEGFQILDRLGSGGMGDVYRAMDSTLEVDVAIKILRSMHPVAQEQFLAEARSAAKLQHPNIVQVLRYGQIGDMGYYVMQMIQGQDAEQLLRSLREHVPQLKETSAEIFSTCRLEPNAITPDLRAIASQPKPYYRIVAYWISGIADGLDKAHTMGVIHRDIKPDNMILAADGRMMLLDFGLAMKKADDRNPGNNLCVGTPRYLSPEMLAAWAAGSGMQGTDERVDIWGLGCTLYEFLAFRPAYDGPVSRVLRDIATLDPMPPRECVWQVPEELEAICMKALARNPEARYRRAAEMADELRAWLAGEAPAAASEAARSKPQGIFSWLKKGK